MAKILKILLFFAFAFSCNENKRIQPKVTENVKQHGIELISNVVKDSTYEEPMTIIPPSDSIHLDKIEHKLTQTKWFKEVMRNSIKVSIMILPPDSADTQHYWFKVGDNRPDRFVTFRQYATKIGVWKLLYYDSETGKLIPVKE